MILVQLLLPTSCENQQFTSSGSSHDDCLEVVNLLYCLTWMVDGWKFPLRLRQALREASSLCISMPSGKFNSGFCISVKTFFVLMFFVVNNNSFHNDVIHVIKMYQAFHLPCFVY